MAGLDTADMPFPKGSPVALANGKSRHDTTLQMKSFLGQSKIDASMNGGHDQSFISNREPPSRRNHADGGNLRESSNGRSYGAGATSKNYRSAVEPTGDDYDRYSRSMMKSPGARYDELYDLVIRDTESVLRVCDDGTNRTGSDGGGLGGRGSGTNGRDRASGVDPLARSGRTYVDKEPLSDRERRDGQPSNRSQNGGSHRDPQPSSRSQKDDRSQNDPQLSDRSQKEHSQQSDRSQRDKERSVPDRLQKPRSQDISDGSESSATGARLLKSSHSAEGPFRDDKLRRKGSSELDDVSSDNRSNSHKSAGGKGGERFAGALNPESLRSTAPARYTAVVAPQGATFDAPQGSTAGVAQQSGTSAAQHGNAGIAGAAQQNTNDGAPQGTRSPTRASPVDLAPVHSADNLHSLGGGGGGGQRSNHETRSALQDGRQSRSISEIIEASGAQSAAADTDDQEDDDFEIDHMLSGGSLSDGSIEVLGDGDIRGGGDGGF